MKICDCIIVGAGPSGVGTAVVLQELGVKNYLIFEKGEVGETFLNWTKETRFVSPSFTSNMFFIPDLNAITPLSSPAFSFNKEHLSGLEYAKYLQAVSEHYKLNIQGNTNIIEINQNESLWELVDSQGKKYFCKYLIWAGGEWSYPKKIFSNTLPTNTIKSYKNLKDKEYVVIGGGESGTDFAYNLVSLGKKVTMITANNILEDNKGDDPSKKLSPVTCAKFNELIKNKNFKLMANTKVLGVDVDQAKLGKKTKNYKIILEHKSTIYSKNLPYEATGFQRVPKIIEKYISMTEEDLDINNFDESKIAKNLFFVGPNLHRQNVILCFIYKFRMRFAVVACEVGKRLGIDVNKIGKVKEYYKKYNMYLEDINSCDINCEC